jgi:glucose-6-phosphate dehydrogenase assembly protein OpcA
MTPATTDQVWRAQDTNPSDIEAALRRLLSDAHRANESYVPARVLNLVCIVDKEYSGEIANRLRGVGRYHPSRTVVCSVSEGRTELDAVATIAAPAEVTPGHFASTRETVIVEMGPQHLEHLDTIVDPLVVTDLHTLVWSPHGHPEAVDALLRLAQIVLVDSVDEPVPADAISRVVELMPRIYVVDLAWLRSTPWRERIAAAFDPPARRPELQRISELTVRHHPDSEIAGLLLVGWLGSRLGWTCTPLVRRGGVTGGMMGTAEAGKQDVRIRLEMDPTMSVRGLAGLTLGLSSGETLSLDRGAGGLHARREDRKGRVRDWTVVGASRGEAGILGEGIRQALLRDPTYKPALECAQGLVA